MSSDKKNALNIEIISDLHCEFHMDKGSSFIFSLDPECVDVLVLAGDINVAENGMLFESLCQFCSRFNSSEVIYIHGNHTFYGSNRAFVLDQTHEAVKCNSNLIWLDNDTVSINEQRFIGTPLWFSNDVENIKHEDRLNDFDQIKDYRKWVYIENHKAIEFIKRELSTDDVVITHHLPSNKSVPSQFMYSPLNRFFVCNLENIILDRQPDLWIHGHTHCHCDYMIGKSRIICNPFGYVHTGEKSEFIEGLVVTI